MRRKYYQYSKNDGFTLIEISIVILIMALMVGGVLLSKEILFSAGIRKQVRQVEEYTIAYGTFKLKYKCMPGDCANASKQLPTAVNGNGNNVLEATAIGNPSELVRDADNNFDLEQYHFFQHLQLAELIPSDITLVGPGYPEAVLARGQGFTAASEFHDPVEVAAFANSFTSQSKDYFASGIWQLGLYFAVGDPNGAWGWKNDFNGLFSPLIMYSIDAKIDDGLPNKGNLRAGTIEWTNWVITTGPNQGIGTDGYCLDNSPASNTVYNNLAGLFTNSTWDKYLISNTATPCIFAWRLE
jgi:prepilin-type N-terminal cleavage/methylation domain-containing protein